MEIERCSEEHNLTLRLTITLTVRECYLEERTVHGREAAQLPKSPARQSCGRSGVQAWLAGSELLAMVLACLGCAAGDPQGSVKSAPSVETYTTMPSQMMAISSISSPLAVNKRTLEVSSKPLRSLRAT